MTHCERIQVRVPHLLHLRAVLPNQALVQLRAEKVGLGGKVTVTVTVTLTLVVAHTHTGTGSVPVTITVTVTSTAIHRQIRYSHGYSCR